MNGPSKVCALITTKYKVYTDSIGVKNGLWPFRCPERKSGIFNTTGASLANNYNAFPISNSNLNLHKYKTKL